jgi:hypothetical protein
VLGVGQLLNCWMVELQHRCCCWTWVPGPPKVCWFLNWKRWVLAHLVGICKRQGKGCWEGEDKKKWRTLANFISLLRINQRTLLSMVFWGKKNCIENANSSFHECLCCLWLSSAETPDVKFQRCLCFQYNVIFCWKVSTLWNYFETVLWKIYQAWPCRTR